LLNQRYDKTRSREVKTELNQSVLRALVFCGISILSISGCNVNVRGKQRPLLRHDRIHGEVELVAERRTDEQGTSGNKRKSKTKVIEERIRLKTEGDIYLRRTENHLMITTYSVNCCVQNRIRRPFMRVSRRI